jgi:phospholipase C
MTSLARRDFLRLAGAVAGASLLPPSIRRALAIPAHSVTGTIADVEHIIVLMQENRSFDHYFGSLRGVRGFDDPRAVQLPDGQPVWQQPAGDGFQLPFRPDADALGLQFMQGTPHDWNTTHQAFNHGRYDQWVAAKGPATMAHLTREDIPFHYALADAFTVCDAYHCSVLGPTDPNRYYLWTGHAGNDGAAGGPAVDNSAADYRWTTYPERLERAGIDWKIYQDVGAGLDSGNYWGWSADAAIGNYGDNALLYFGQYQAAVPGSALFEKARTGTQAALGEDLFERFRTDVASGRLPQVSWIVAPEAHSEHPDWPANYGAWYVAQILDALTANPAVWSKTALFLTYDENDGFFDHVVPPVVAASRAQGLSTVSVENEFFAGTSEHVAGPFGLGPRVPMLVISPWSRGGYVNSQVFDHTSIIRFIEQRFGAAHPEVIETQISSWRRAVCGDLTSAFDFSTPNASLPTLPDTATYHASRTQRLATFTPMPPAVQTMPRQEFGVRPARALPYALNVVGRQLADASFMLEFRNNGSVGAVFQVRSLVREDGPWVYTVEAGKALVETWSTRPADFALYDFSVTGPDGFFCRFAGNASADSNSAGHAAEVDLAVTNGAGLELRLHNRGSARRELRVVDGYSAAAFDYALEANETQRVKWDSSASLGWYDLRVSDPADADFQRQFAGRIGNGQTGFSDPKIGAAGAH